MLACTRRTCAVRTPRATAQTTTRRKTRHGSSRPERAFSSRFCLRARTREIAECGNHFRVSVALEGHYELGKRIDIEPAPRGKFRLGGMDIDLGVIAQKPHREPFLPLTAISSAQCHTQEASGKVVGEPFIMLAQKFRIPRSDFLLQFTEGGFDRRLAFVDSALG